jgi:hypothetical protein
MASARAVLRLGVRLRLRARRIIYSFLIASFLIFPSHLSLRPFLSPLLLLHLFIFGWGASCSLVFFNPSFLPIDLSAFSPTPSPSFPARNVTGAFALFDHSLFHFTVLLSLIFSPFPPPSNPFWPCCLFLFCAALRPARSALLIPFYFIRGVAR